MHWISPRRTWLVLALLALVVVGCSSDRSDLSGPTALLPAEGGSWAVPPGYYDTVDTSDPGALRLTLHEAIDDNVKIPYTSSALDTWDVLEQADEDPGDASRILDLYLNASYPKYGEGNTDYNREHCWPKSYGFPNDGSTNYPYTDCHHLFLANDSYNSSRSNKPFRDCGAACDEKPTEVNDGAGGGSGVYPGNSNWTSGAYTEGTWETWIGRRGDVARALFYMDVRYEGGVHGITGAAEPDLILTDDEALIAASNTGSNEAVAYMGMLTVLLAWHQQDPVDDKERARNEAVYAAQGNRNPFIDHPEWVDCLFAGACGGGGDTTPPAAPTGLLALAGDGTVDLDWDDNAEADLGGYLVYRSDTGGAPWTSLTATPVAASAFTDAGATNGVTWTYAVSAVDDSGNESGLSATASATPTGGGGVASVWINEFHYDNDSTDTGEFVEVAGTAGADLTGWILYGYNGNGGTVYDTVALGGTVPDQQDGYGTVAVAFTGLQNGSPDGIALVDAQGAVVEFLSYEGTLVAVDGPAAGMTSIDVGVDEPSTTPVGWSLQRQGTGTAAADFAWAGPLAATEGAVNTGQTFGSGGGDTTPPAAPTALAAIAGDGRVDLDWADSAEPDLDGYTVYRSASSGGPWTALNATLLGVSDYADPDVTNGATYWYTVTASDLSGNESAPSAEVDATPSAPVADTVHVASIACGVEWIAGGKFGKAQATVAVEDQDGAPVGGVQVTLTFSGAIDETVSGVTDASGAVTLTSGRKAKPPVSYQACVDDLSAVGFTYEPGANVETCDGFSS